MKKEGRKEERSGSRIKGIENKNGALSQLFCWSFAFYTQKSVQNL